MKIRKYNSDDIKQFTDLMPDLGYPSSLDEMKVRMKRIESNPNYYTFVAINDNNLVGMNINKIHMGGNTNIYDGVGIDGLPIRLFLDGNGKIISAFPRQGR
ncbi:acetyltransferase GNAT family [Bacillus cereus]|nr:acetyltransferase GNAT family [Bacillus cereus]